MSTEPQTAIVESPDMVELMRQPEETALKAVTSSQIDRAIATARAYPRHLGQCVDAITTMATRTAETAMACRYRKPIGGGKFAEGPSIRLAEIMAACWSNIDVGPAAIDIHDRHVEAHVSVYDLQRNSRFAGSCIKSIMYSAKGSRAGSRFSDDQIAVTASAAAAIARRNAITNAIPRVFWEPVLARCKAVAAGAIKDLKTITKQMLDALKGRGVDEARVLAFLGRESTAEITAEDIVELQSVGEAVKTGDLTMEEAFPAPAAPVAAGHESKPASRTAAVAAKVAEKAKAATPQPTDDNLSPTAPQVASKPDAGETPAGEVLGLAAANLFIKLPAATKAKLKENYGFQSSDEFRTWKTRDLNDLMTEMKDLAK